MFIKELLPNYSLEYKYKLLKNSKKHCDYYLNNKNGVTNNLWNFKGIKKQVVDMKLIYNSFSEEEQPEWLTMKQIEKFEQDLKQKKVKPNIKLKIKDLSVNDNTVIDLMSDITAKEIVDVINYEKEKVIKNFTSVLLISENTRDEGFTSEDYRAEGDELILVNKFDDKNIIKFNLKEKVLIETNSFATYKYFMHTKEFTVLTTGTNEEENKIKTLIEILMKKVIYEN